MKVAVLGPSPPIYSGSLEAIWIPIIKIEPRRGSSITVVELLSSRYRAVVFTSPRGPMVLAMDAIMHGVFGRLKRLLDEALIAVVGPRTGEAVRRFFMVEWDIMPSVYTGSSLAVELVNRGVDNVVLARSSRGIRDLPETLARRGVNYAEAVVYDEMLDQSGIDRVASLVMLGVVNAVLLTSPFIAEAFCSSIGKYTGDVRLYAIGPSTARSIRDKCGIQARYPDNYTYSSALSLIEYDLKMR